MASPPAKIGGAIFGMSHAWGSERAVGSKMGNDDPNPGMKLEMRPPIASESTPALESVSPRLSAPAAPSEAVC